MAQENEIIKAKGWIDTEVWIRHAREIEDLRENAWRKSYIPKLDPELQAQMKLELEQEEKHTTNTGNHSTTLKD